MRLSKELDIQIRNLIEYQTFLIISGKRIIRRHQQNMVRSRAVSIALSCSILSGLVRINTEDTGTVCSYIIYAEENPFNLETPLFFTYLHSL